MSKLLLMYAIRTGRRILPAILLTCLVVTSAVAGGVVAEDGNQDGDAPDERTSAQQLEAGETIEGTLSDGDDVDWYAVNATAGNAIVATLELLNMSGNRSVEVNVYDASGQLATEEERDKMSGPRRVAGKNPGSRQESTAHAPDVAESTGTYYVEVRESRWNETGEGVASPYNLTVTTEALDEYDPNENGTTATPIDVDQSITGVVAPYDHDVFAVDLSAGENYTITFNHTSASASRYSKALTLYTNASNVTDDNPGFGIWGIRMASNASGTLTAEESGTHYLRLGQSGITATLLERADYRLTISRTDSSTGNETDEGDDPSSGEDTPTEDDETPIDDAGNDTDDTETPLSADASPTDDNTVDGDSTLSEPVTTDTGTRTLIDDSDTTPTESTTAMASGGGGGSIEVTTTPTPTGGSGPGFGVIAGLVSLLAIARVASSRSW